jgi:hypothetical protein
MLRNQWVFQFGTAQLAEAARAKVKFHEARLEFWTGAKKKIMEEIKDSGIEVVESAAGSNYTKGPMTPHLTVRVDLQTRLEEAHAKMTEHTQKIREYSSWIEVLEANVTRLDLHADDYLFFFGK